MLRQYAAAEALLRRALVIRERGAGSEPVELAGTLDNLALLLAVQSKYKESVPCFGRALEIQVKALGPDHPKVAKTITDMACVWHVLAVRAGSYRKGDKAKIKSLVQFIERALKIREKSLGPDHVSVAESLNALAVVYVYQKRYEEAEPILGRALEILEKKHSESVLMSRVIDAYVYVLRKNHFDLKTRWEARGWAARARAIRAQHRPDIIAGRWDLPSDSAAEEEVSTAGKPVLR
jgi:tetratricopeptide (TPR) repeat protein